MKNSCTVILVLTFLLMGVESHAQLSPYHWRLGLGIGYSHYLMPNQIKKISDIPQIYALPLPFHPERNWTLSLEKRLSPGLGLAFLGGESTFEGTSSFSSTGHFGNGQGRDYQASVVNLGSSLVFRADNGKIIRENAKLAPYLSLGAGWLYRKGKSPEPNTFSSLLEINPNETVNFSTNQLYWTGGIGIRVKATNQLELFIQSDMQGNLHLFEDADPGSDILKRNGYQENPDVPPLDWVFNHRMGLKFSFIPAKSAYRANVISPSSTPPQSREEKRKPNPDPKTDKSTEIIKRDTLELSQNTPPTSFPKGSREGDATESDREEQTVSGYNYPGWESSEPGLSMSSAPPPDYQYRVIYSNPPPTTYDSYTERDYLGYHPDQIRPTYRSTQKSSPPINNKRRYLPILAVPFLGRPAALPLPADSSGINNRMAYTFPKVQERNSSSGLRLDPQRVTWNFHPNSPSWDLAVPGLPVTRVQENGAEKTLSYELPVSYAVIYFAKEQSELSELALEKLASIAASLQEYPQAVVSIKGFADHTGSISYNMALIERRSEAVADALKEKMGIAPEKIQIQPGALLVRGSYKSPRKEDRMVEIQILF
ncbi:OmpA family protein [Cyclobacterium plantarum]|uniref:OmpA family protein n=1 Tax=Cyclobacterium plantarum TaxID=2716263 RepID=A0ABX0H6V2_9BACT|nr:OmpA family protein [Cyclobacterium plantarum]NHE56618.1 OmpA family protein [Cyclobacterium plantarum]